MMKCSVLDYYKNNTQLEITDLFKFIFQSSFGCEHLVSDHERALTWIRQEAEQADADDLPNVEYLDGEYCRVHLKALRTEAALEKLCQAFISSSQVHPEGVKKLEEQLKALSEYREKGMILFDRTELEEKIDEWRKAGFPAIHHSDAFREAHHPAYRVIKQVYLQDLNMYMEDAPDVIEKQGL